MRTATYGKGVLTSTKLSVISGTTNAVVKDTVVVFLYAQHGNIAVNPITNKIYAFSPFSPISVIDGKTNMEKYSIITRDGLNLPPSSDASINPKTNIICASAPLLYPIYAAI